MNPGHLAPSRVEADTFQGRVEAPFLPPVGQALTQWRAMPFGISGGQASYLHIPPGDEALAFCVTGLKEFLCLAQHGQLSWRKLPGLLMLQVVQETQADPPLF